MRRGITRALSPSRHRREARRVGTANLMWVGLLISLPCFSAERNSTTDKTLLTTNVVWQSFTNVSRFEPSIVSSNALWRSFTNAPPFQTGMWFRLRPFSLPPTNSTKEQRELFLKRLRSFQQQDWLKLAPEHAPSNRLGDYWLPGEFQRIMGRPMRSTPSEESQH